jgi:hypothetical protein
MVFRRVFQSNVHAVVLASVCATYPPHLNRLNLTAEDFIYLEVHLFFFSNMRKVRFQILTAVLVGRDAVCRLANSCRRFEVDMA